MRGKADTAVVGQTRDLLQSLGVGRGPIIVGPWLSEIGFELLYWIPFLRWACAFAGLRPEDLWIVSRGGCRAWYADLSGQYLDVLDFYGPDAFRAGNDRRMTEQAALASSCGIRHGQRSTKQHMITAFDREILARVTRVMGTEVTPRVLHPSVMYRLFRPFWRRQLPDLYRQMTTPRRIASRTVLIEGLPERYVAAKFYASEACPVTQRRAVSDLVRKLSQSIDVVVLDSATQYDDHGDLSVERLPRVHHVPMVPSTNLDTQTAVIAGARSFVGTYGGFSYLAPFLGVPARTFYGRPTFRRDHQQVIMQVSQQTLRVPFSVESFVARKAVRCAA